jgi:lipoyl(octanoyl) transferase
VLGVYLLGGLDFDSFLALQRRLIYDVSGGSGDGAVVVCDLPPGITVGRAGSRLHIRFNPDELVARGWPVRWVARGGGVMLHAPGQVSVAPILPLSVLGLTPAGYVRELCRAVAAALGHFDISAVEDDRTPGVVVGRRRVAHVGVAVRHGVTAFGAVVNVCPDLEPFRGLDCDGDPHPMTSVNREAPLPARPAAVRQLLTDEVARRFGYDRVSVFHSHPALAAGPTRHAPVAAGR